MRRALFALPVLLAMVAAGCGSSQTSGSDNGNPYGNGATPSGGASATTAGGGAVQACSLLTKAEIEAAVGGSVAEGFPDATNECNWEKSAQTGTTVDVHLTQLPQTLKCAADIQGKTIDGIPGHSFWNYLPNLYTGSVTACAPGWQVQVVLVGDLVNHSTTEDELRTAAIALTKLVLPRM